MYIEVLVVDNAACFVSELRVPEQVWYGKCERDRPVAISVGVRRAILGKQEQAVAKLIELCGGHGQSDPRLRSGSPPRSDERQVILVDCIEHPSLRDSGLK